MATKAVPDVPSPMPPPPSPADSLLASSISLPPSPTVAVAVYRPTVSLDSLTSAHDVIELARRQVLSRNTSPILLDNILPHVCCGKQPTLYLFQLTTQDEANSALHRFSELHFENLDHTSHTTFHLQSLLSSEHAQLHARFLEAVRSFVLADLSEVAAESSAGTSTKRLGDGFILERKLSSSDWASGWDQSAHTRPIIHFRLQIQLSYTDNSPSRLIVHAIPVSTPYTHLPSSPHPGLPIVLLPYGTPAYFLNGYNGPSHSLLKQFRESLAGLGAGTWEGPSQSRGSIDSDRTSFIVGWIRVENRQGEDKGTLFVWPSRLCLAYSDAYKPKQTLSYIPEMPAPLQASPQLPSQDGVVSGETDEHSRFPENALPFQHELFHTPPHADPLHAFHSFTMSKSKGIRSLANEVGGYVDSVVRDRERERERLKKERGLSTTSPKLARNAVQPSGSSTSAGVQLPVPSTSQMSTVIPSSHPHGSLVQQAEAFYPSPPQSGQTPHAPPTDNTSPEMHPVVLPHEPAQSTYPSEATPNVPPPPSSRPEVDREDAYDSLFDDSSAWVQSSNDNSFMGMDFSMNMDVDMDFSMNMDMPSSRPPGSNPFGATVHSNTLTFDDAFTDDDFSFFDQPSKSNPPPPPASTAISTVSVAASTLIQPIPMDFDLSLPSHTPQHHRRPSLDQPPGASGPGPPYSAPFQGAPWTPATQGDMATPNDSHRLSSLPPAPELASTTPGGGSPDFHQLSPATPTVQLVFDDTTISASPGTQRALNSNVSFDPIPFSARHKNIDGKYSHGKFAFLPSPSPEPGYDPTPLPTPTSWRSRYNSLTDPRIGVVKQLIGVKRKTSAVPSPPKRHAHDSDWMDIGSSTHNTAVTCTSDEAMDTSSDSESEEEDGLSATSDPSNASPLQSRPCTPPPAYLPPGSTLLHLQFTHAPLLSLSTPLRSPGAIPLQTHYPTGLGRGSVPPFASVPTPVSPAAALGVASEQNKFLESTAHAIAVEFVENSLWADVWRVNNQRSGHNGVHDTAVRAAVWPDDLKAAADVMGKVRIGARAEGQEAGLCRVASIFGIEPNTKLVSYEPPPISVGRGDAVITLLPTALRFWQKLGLGPKGGRKDVEVYAFYEDLNDQKRAVVDGWLNAASAAYSAKNMGQFIRGCTNPANDALLPIRFDASFRKTFSLFMSNVISDGPPVVIILFVPVTSMTFASPSLRSVISSTKKVLKNFNDRQLMFHLVPDSYLIDLEHSPRGYTVLDELCTSLYNRIQVEVDRNLSRRISSCHRNTNATRFQEPTFTLARSPNSKVSLVRSAHTSLDVVDRFTFLHIGYRISPCQKWVFACCVDQRGEEYALGLWLVPPLDSGEGGDGENDAGDEKRSPACERYAIDRVWSFARGVARKADVEWRVVVTKLGLMSSAEVQAWTELSIQDTTDRPQTSTPLHIILVSAECNSPFTLIPNTPSSPSASTVSPARMHSKAVTSSAKTGIQFSDISATFYAIFPTIKLSTVAPPNLDVYYASLVADPTSTISSGGTVGYEAAHPDSQNDSSAAPSPVHSTVSSYANVTLPCGQEDISSLPHPIPLIPLSSSTLIRVPSTSTTTSMLHIYILKTLDPSHHDAEPATTLSSSPPSIDELTRDLTRNFYELSVLASARFHLDRCEAVGIDAVLPLHLSAVEAMRFSVDCEWEGEALDTEPGVE